MFFVSLSAVTAQSDHRSAGTSSSVPTTQCQVAIADPESVADYQRGSREDGEGGDGDEQQRGLEVPVVLQAGVMSAISVLEVQFDNNVQFLPKSKILLPAGFTFGNEKLNALSAKEAHVMKLGLGVN